MVKKIMKAALAASLLFGMSAYAYAADVNVGGSFREYYGQYNSGADDYSANFADFGEVNLKIKAKTGKLSLYHEMEARNQAVKTGSSEDYNNTQTKLSYVTPIGLVSIGNQSSVGVIPMTSSGWKTSRIPNSIASSLGYAGYAESEGLGITIPLEGLGFVQAIMYEDASNGTSDQAKLIVMAATYAGALAQGASTAAASAAAAAAVPSTTDGSSTQLAANLTFGGIGVRLGYATAKTDDPAVTDDDPMSTTNMLLGIKVPLGKQMTISFDYTSAKVTYDPWSDDITGGNIDLGLIMGGVGDGKIYVMYDMQTVKAGDKLFDKTTTSLVWDTPVNKTAGIQVGYIGTTTKTESTGDSATESFMGAGFYASF